MKSPIEDRNHPRPNDDAARRVPMFSGPGHRDTIWTDVKGEVARSRQINWEGGTAACTRLAWTTKEGTNV